VSLYLTSRLLADAGFRHGFSLRSGGVSAAPLDSLNLARNLGDDPAAVAENHRRLAQAIGYAPERLFEVSQVHGCAVEQVLARDQPSDLRCREADALLARGPDQAVGVRVADCVPILLAHPRSGAVAAVHAGWRGVAADIVGAAVRALAGSAQPEELLAAIGPHIGVEAFEVGHEVAEQLARSVPEEARVVIHREPRPHVDLARGVRAQLERAGLRAERIERVPGCTFAEPARFFSFRRDGQSSGRQLAVIVAGC
jgi:YfiH family protein